MQDAAPLLIKSILVVCVGNICRSPTGEALLQARLAERGVQVRSAGLGALVGKGVEATAAELMAEHGLALPEHQARKLTPAMLAEADLVLAMEPRHIQSIHAMAPQSRGKTFLYGKWLGDREIPDPYRQSRPAFEHVYSLLEQASDAWLPYLK